MTRAGTLEEPVLREHATAPAPSRALRFVRDTSTSLLRMYAGIFFSDSLAVGVLVLLATALVPVSGALGLFAVAAAVVTARLLGLVSSESPAPVFAYSALFLGLGASHTFGTPGAALALAGLGGAVSALVTAAISGWLRPLGLPALSLPFLLVYCCAISLGISVGATWAEPALGPALNAFGWPPALRLFLEALGALLFTPRIDVGLAVFASLCVRGAHAPLLAVLAFGVGMLADQALTFDEGLRFGALINGIFTAIVLGAGLVAPTAASYVRALLGVLLSVLLTLALAAPLGRLGLSPVSLPFNLTIFAALLIARQRESQYPSTFVKTKE